MPEGKTKKQDTIVTVDENIESYETLTRRFKNINAKIKYSIEFINNNINSTKQDEIKQVGLHLDYLEHLYQAIPTLPKIQKTKNEQTYGWKTFSAVTALVLFGVGVAARTAQRAFSTDVVAFNLKNDTFVEEIESLADGMWKALKTPQNHGLAATDIVFSFVASLFPFAIKDLLNLGKQSDDTKPINLNDFMPLEIIIQFLEKGISAKNYAALAIYREKMSELCDQLESYTEKCETENTAIEMPHEKRIVELNKITKVADLKKQDYSPKTIAKNTMSNIITWGKSNGVSHAVITLSSSYTAKTLTSLNHYIEMLTNPANFVSTFTRATAMKVVNQYLIKNSLETLINACLPCCSKQQTPISLDEVKKTINQSIKKLKKPTQAAIIITSFVLVTFISNFIKTFAADLTQNDGDASKALDQMNETFWTFAMVGIAMLVTSSDMLILQLKMKDVLKLRAQNQKQQKMIDDIFAKNLIKPEDYEKQANRYYKNRSDVIIEEIDNHKSIDQTPVATITDPTPKPSDASTDWVAFSDDSNKKPSLIIHAEIHQPDVLDSDTDSVENMTTPLYQPTTSSNLSYEN